METFVKKPSLNLNILQSMRKFLTEIQAKSLVSSFLNHQFGYCAVISMFCSWKSKLELATQQAVTCSKLTIETLQQGLNFEHIYHLILVFPLLTLSRQMPSGKYS